MDAFIGKFDFVESSGLDCYLRSLGVGLILRKVMSVSTPSLEISQNRNTNTWTFKISSIFHTQELKFKLSEAAEGVVVDDETLDARPCKTIVHYEKNGLVMSQMVEEHDHDAGSPHVIVTLQKYDNNALKLTHSAGNGKYSCFFVFKPSGQH